MKDKTKKFFGGLKGFLKIFLLILILGLNIFFAYPLLTGKADTKNESYPEIIRVWQIDAFEGGKGSRTAYLRSVAQMFEKKNKNTLVLVTSHTAESAAYSIERGEYPDLISYGVGADFVADYAIPLKNFNSPMCAVGNETVGVPWCRGSYFVFTKEGDFSDISAENCVISQGYGSLIRVGAALAGVHGEFIVENTLNAYSQFLNGKFKYMVGTQRDVSRFSSVNVNASFKVLTEFCDLYQYISVLSKDTATYNACLEFIGMLTSEKSQKNLEKYGLLSIKFPVYDAGQTMLYEAQNVIPQYGISVFLSEEVRVKLDELAAAAMKGDAASLKKIKNYLV